MTPVTVTAHPELSPDDVVRLQAVRNGTVWMRRGASAEWIARMKGLGLVRRRRACESNAWLEDIVLTPAGLVAVRAEGAR